MPSIVVYGTGVDVILYEISAHDYAEIKQQVENDEVDWDEIECRSEEADFMGASWPLDVLHDDSRAPRNLRDLPASDHHKKMPFGIVAADHKCSSNTIFLAN